MLHYCIRSQYYFITQLLFFPGASKRFCGLFNASHTFVSHVNSYSRSLLENYIPVTFPDFFKSYYSVIIILGKDDGKDINEYNLYPILKSLENSKYVLVICHFNNYCSPQHSQLWLEVMIGASKELYTQISLVQCLRAWISEECF